MMHPFGLTIDDLACIELIDQDQDQVEGGATSELSLSKLTWGRHEGGGIPTYKHYEHGGPIISGARYPEHGGPIVSTAVYPEHGGPIVVGPVTHGPIAY